MNYDKLFFDLSDSVHKEISSEELSVINYNLKHEINIKETKEKIKKVLDSSVKPFLESISKKDLESIALDFEKKIENLQNTANAVFEEEGNAYASAALDLSLCNYVIKYQEKVSDKNSDLQKTAKKGNRFTNFIKNLFNVNEDKNL